MAVVTLNLEIEYAHAMFGGEPEGVQSYFVRGGHYHHAFWLAMHREAAEQQWRITCTEHQLMHHVQWVYWREVPLESGAWEYQNTTVDKGFPVTVLDVDDLARLTVPICRACMKGEHENCDIRKFSGPVRLTHRGQEVKVRGRRRRYWDSRNTRW